MPEGKYQFNKEYTAEEREMDDTYGILDTDSREITFTAPNHFKFTYQYFYQYENSFYEMVTDIRNDTVLSGTYVLDGNKVVATIVSGEQIAKVTVGKCRTMSRRRIWAARETSQGASDSRKWRKGLRW